MASYGAPVLAVFDLGVLLCQEQANVEAGMDIRDATVDDAAAIARIYNQGIEDRVATLETRVRTPEERAEWLAARSARHPVLVAKMVANLQALSRGRLVLGVGAGWMKEEFDLLGAAYATRGTETDEHIRRLRRLWKGEEPGVGFEPRPRPLPPILIGGSSGPALRRAARLGDGWNAIRMSPDEIGATIGRLQVMLREQGREPSGFSIVLRAPLPVDGAAEKLDEYARVGVTEFTVEVPEASTKARLEHLAQIGSAVGLRPL